MKSLKIYESSLGFNHSSTAETIYNIGSIFSIKGEDDIALEYYMKSLKIYASSLGDVHLSTAFAIGGIGIVYSSKGEDDKALEYCNKGLILSTNKSNISSMLSCTQLLRTQYLA